MLVRIFYRFKILIMLRRDRQLGWYRRLKSYRDILINFVHSWTSEAAEILRDIFCLVFVRFLGPFWRSQKLGALCWLLGGSNRPFVRILFLRKSCDFGVNSQWILRHVFNLVMTWQNFRLDPKSFFDVFSSVILPSWVQIIIQNGMLRFRSLQL